MRLRQRVPDGIEDRPVRAGRFQLNGPRKREHRRAVPAQVPRHQWQVVVAVMGSQSVDVGDSRDETSAAFHALAGQLHHRGIISCCHRIEMEKNLPIVLDEPFGHGLVMGTDVLQFRPGSLGDGRDSLAATPCNHASVSPRLSNPLQNLDLFPERRPRRPARRLFEPVERTRARGAGHVQQIV